MVFFAEAYFAGLIRETLYDVDGTRLGRIVDVVVQPRERYPVVTKVVFLKSGSKERFVVPWHVVR
ncbi:MAG: PRC-barrel domain-containing protein, partial [Armatimonadota bacterium]